jgi:hypothetical protein
VSDSATVNEVAVAVPNASQTPVITLNKAKASYSAPGGSFPISPGTVGVTTIAAGDVSNWAVIPPPLRHPQDRTAALVAYAVNDKNDRLVIEMLSDSSGVTTSCHFFGDGRNQGSSFRGHGCAVTGTPAAAVVTLSGTS